MKVICTALDCIHQDSEKNICTAKQINLSCGFIHTKNEGMKQAWRCRMYEEETEVLLRSMAFVKFMKEKIEGSDHN